MFRESLILLFERFEFKGAYQATLRSFRQSKSKSVTAYAARVTDLCSSGYLYFSTDDQLSLAVNHLISGIPDTSSRDYLMRKQARRPLECKKLFASRRRAKLHVCRNRCTRTQPPCCFERIITPMARLRALLQSTQLHVTMRVIGKKNAHAPCSRQPRTDRDSEKQSRHLPKQKYSNSRDQATPCDPPPYEKTNDAMATRIMYKYSNLIMIQIAI